jgi:sulfate adenylyltransferase
VLNISGTELRQRVNEGRDLPGWFTYSDMPRSYAAVFHHGISRSEYSSVGWPGAWKSTIANVLFIKFQEVGGRPVTLLDGDLVRKYRSSELGFSKAQRDINIRRIGYVASEITKNRGV